jgi:hypothetical protein
MTALWFIAGVALSDAIAEASAPSSPKSEVRSKPRREVERRRLTP